MKYFPLKSCSLQTLKFSGLLLLPWLAVFLLGPAFEANDDVANILLFRGVFGSGSVDTSIFVSLPLTQILSFFYTVNHVVPWYPILLYLLILASQLILILVVESSAVTTPMRTILLVFVSFVVFRLALGCSFTAVAVLLSFSALMYGLYSIENGRYGSPVAALILLAFGYMLRPGVFPVALLVFAPVVITVLTARSVAYRKMLIYGFFVLLVVGLLFAADLVFESQARKDFKVQNSVRAKFSDSAWGGMSDSFNKALFVADWNKDDYFVAKYLSWFLDESVHSPAAIDAFIAVNQKVDPVPWNRQNLLTALQVNKFPFVLFMVALFGWLIVERGFRRPFIFAGIGVAVCCLLLLAGIRFPPRIAYPFFLALALVPLAGSFTGGRKILHTNGWLKSFALVLAVVFVWAGVEDIKTIRNMLRYNKVLGVAVNDGLQQTIETVGNPLFVPLLLRGYSVANFSVPFQWSDLHRSIPLGWLAQSPVRDEALITEGFNTDLPIVPQLLAREDVVWYFLANRSEVNNLVLEPFSRYINNNYSLDTGKTYWIPRIITVKEAGAMGWYYFQIGQSKR